VGPETDDGERELRKPALALHVEIMPQFRDMVYKSGDPLECPYGEGTRLLAWTTWAEDSFEIERRMYDALRAVYGADAVDLDDRVDDARRVRKPRHTFGSQSGRRTPLSKRSSSRSSSSIGAVRARSTPTSDDSKKAG